jgi:hypothetical protein
MPIIQLRPRLVLTRTAVEWDEGRQMYVAACDRCTEAVFIERLDQAHEWADEHRCDPELVALLTAVLHRRAA